MSKITSKSDQPDGEREKKTLIFQYLLIYCLWIIFSLRKYYFFILTFQPTKYKKKPEKDFSFLERSGK
jgi:hypothetical protein